MIFGFAIENLAKTVYSISFTPP